MSNLKIDEILKNDKNYIGTFSKDNVPILKNNQSTNIFKAVLPYAKDFAKKIIPALGVATTSTLVSHGVNKALNKKNRW